MKYYFIYKLIVFSVTYISEFDPTMTALPATAIVDSAKIDELLKKLDNKKKLEEMLMDPRIIELSKKSPQSRQALAAIVRRLQEERERKRSVKGGENKEELQPQNSSRWFDCVNIIRPFAAAPRQGRSLRSSDRTIRQRNKLTVSTPNLESTALPDVPQPEGSLLQKQMVASSQSIDIKTGMTLCITNSGRENSLPLNILEFCTSDKGRAMISSLINNTDIKELFGLKLSPMPTESLPLVLYMDNYNLNNMKSIQCHTFPTIYGQATIVLKSGRTKYKAISDESLKHVVTSATQTVYSGSCSLCSSNCPSTDSYTSYNDSISRRSITSDPKYKRVIEVAEQLVKANSGFTKNFNNKCSNQQLKSDKSIFIKTSKSQSAMYSTEYSECDCDNLSSVDDISGGKYISRILTSAGAPCANYLTTPDVLVSYSQGQQSSDTESSSSSCEACRQLRHFSSESFNCEPSQTWTRKRMKTSCESCVTTFRTEIIRKAKYCNEIPHFADKGESYSSLSHSDERIETNEENRINQNVERGVYEKYASVKKALDEKPARSILDLGMPKEEKEVSAHNEKILVHRQVNENSHFVSHKEGKIIRKINLVNEPSIDLKDEGTPADLANGKRPEITDSESLLDLPDKYETEPNSNPIKINENKEESIGEKETPVCQGGRSSCRVEDDSAKERKPQPNSDSMDDSSGSCSSAIPRTRKQRKRMRNKSMSEVSITNSSSNSSEPQARVFPRRLKPMAGSSRNLLVPENQQQKVTKEKSRHKTCVIM